MQILVIRIQEGGQLRRRLESQETSEIIAETRFQKESKERLIERSEAEPFLWDLFSKEYNFKDKREKVLHKIKEEPEILFELSCWERV